jgi:Ca-activated chloride channel family protein
MRFKALFNLGNIAYKQSDFELAVAHFKQAVVFDPTSEDARHNLELALRQLEKQQNRTSGGQEAEHPKDGGEPQDEQSAQKGGKDKRGTDAQSPEEKSSDDVSSRAQDQPESGQGEETIEGDDSNPEAGQQEPQDPPGDLSGDLQALHDLPEDQGEGQTLGLAPIDRKKAEALLDNIQEDRSRFLRFQVPKEKRYGVQSGKEW